MIKLTKLMVHLGTPSAPTLCLVCNITVSSLVLPDTFYQYHSPGTVRVSYLALPMDESGGRKKDKQIKVFYSKKTITGLINCTNFSYTSDFQLNITIVEVF